MRVVQQHPEFKNLNELFTSGKAQEPKEAAQEALRLAENSKITLPLQKHLHKIGKMLKQAPGPVVVTDLE